MPPLSVWVFLLFAAICLSTCIFFVERSNRLYKKASTENFIRKEFGTANGKPVILIIGTSLVISGLTSCDSLAASIQETTGRDVTVMKLWKPSGLLSSMITELPSLQQVKPSIVVVESNMLFYRGAPNPFLTRYLQTFRDMLTFADLHEPYQPDLRPVFPPLGNLTVEDMRDGLVDSTDLVSFRELANRWQSYGTRFLLVNFPIEVSTELKKWNSPDTAAFNRNLDYLKQKISLEYNFTHFNMDSSYFYDNAHLVPKGNKIFSALICGLVALQMKKL